MNPAELIRLKRDGLALQAAQIQAFVDGLTSGDWSDAQVGAMAMAVLLRGMSRDETVALTRAMTHSGQVLDWRDAALNGPVLDKHSTGGVGDKVSLMLAPIVAACGGVVPMISGRGLGHTGGTLDKLESLAGYTITPTREHLLATLREAGCAIVGASAALAPADRRLYAIRDVTATVESLPLITASILSKKLAAGLQALVMDVKLGNGAFCATLDQAQSLADSLVEVARGAGLPTTALITDMNQVLGHSAGNALEVREAIDFLCGREREPRLLEVTLALSAHLLWRGGLADDLAQGRAQAQAALASGAAAERFARMVAALGGPRDVLRGELPGRSRGGSQDAPGAATDGAALPLAPVVCDLRAPHEGVLLAMDTRAIGLAVVALGGGRRVADDRVDPRVGFDRMLPLGSGVRAGEPLARVHAATRSDADAAAARLLAALHIQRIEAQPGTTFSPAPVVHAVIGEPV